MISFKSHGRRSNCRTGLVALLIALALAASSSAAPQLVVSGATPEAGWLRERETFIAAMAKKYASLQPHLPIEYRLDPDFVTAARTRNSINVVDVCGEHVLCGVASREVPDAWEIADLRAMFDVSIERAAQLLGRYEGQDIDQLAADVKRAGVEGSTDARVQIALHASTKTENRQPAHPATCPPMKGATLSIVNRLDQHLISNNSIEQIKRLHAACYDEITLIPFASQRGTQATEIMSFDQHPAGETDLAILLGAARAHAAGMAVMIKPQIWVRGDGDTTHVEPSDSPRWFAAYEQFLIHNALLARAAKAEWLVIGTELTRTESRPEWRRMIAIARALFPGRITYAANFDAFEKTPFWDALDAVGIDAYFPLSPDPQASDRALRAGADAVVARVDALARKYARPVLFTELGYPSRAAAWTAPWTEERGSSPDDSAQTRSFDAILRAVRRSKAIRGFVIWKYETAPRAGNRYLPNSAAEKLICK